MFKTLLVVLTLSVCVFSEENWIDKKLTKCENSNGTTLDQVTCLADAEAEWDKELNKNYKKLMTLLDKNGKQQLKETQLKWLAYRDNEIRLISGVANVIQRTNIYSANRRVEITKARAQELDEYISWLNESN